MRQVTAQFEEQVLKRYYIQHHPHMLKTLSPNKLNVEVTKNSGG